MNNFRTRTLEKTIATASFLVAVALSFISLLISKDHDIASGVLMTVAQFLTLTATILGIDYKFTTTDKGFTAGERKTPNTE